MDDVYAREATHAGVCRLCVETVTASGVLTDASQPLARFSARPRTQGGSPCATSHSSLPCSPQPFSRRSRHPLTGCGSASTTTRSCATTPIARPRCKPRRPPTTRRSSDLSSPGPTLLRRSPRTPRTRSTLPIASMTWTTSSVRRRRTTPRSCSTLWGTPKWANGNKGRNYLPTSMAEFQNFARGRCHPVLRTHRRLPVRQVLRDLERVESRALPQPPVQLQGCDRQPCRVREARGSGLRRSQGREREGARCDR